MNSANPLCLAIALGTFALLLMSCAPDSAHEPRGFRLPEGDAGRGKTAFVELACLDCHTVRGAELPPQDRGVWNLQIELGGPVTEVKSYAELVTSIIHPNHVVDPKYQGEFVNETGDSVMPDFAESMTVQQMIDLVEFLHPHYGVGLPEAPGNSMP